MGLVATKPESSSRGKGRTQSMEFAAAKGARLACRTDGEHGLPAVVLCNSLASDHSMWDAQIALLAPHSWVIRYDTRGHGASDASEGPYSIEQLAQDCLAVLDHYRIERAHFVGLSLGGMTGQWLGAEAASRFLSLTLCDTASDMPTDLWEQRIAQVHEHGIASIVETTVERWFTAPFRDREAAEVARVKAMIAATSEAGYLGCAAAIRDMALEPLLARISLPTQIIVGAKDVSTPPSEAERINRGIAGSNLAVVPDAAHLPNIEQADTFNQALWAFLQRQIGASVP